MNRTAKITAIVLLFIALVAVNYLASAIPLRFDATAEKIYTLSPGTRSLLSKIEDPVQLQLYYSRAAEGLPISFKNYAARIEEMLRQYVRASGGKLQLEVIDPRPDTPEEEAATSAGLSGQQLPTGEVVFLGLVATQADQQKSIAAFSPQRESFLEYDISQLLHSVQLWDKPRVGLLSTVPLRGQFDMAAMQRGRPPPSQFVLSEWGRSFEIVSIEPSATTLPENLDALALVHPAGLSTELQKSIDQFVLSGKPALICVDPLSRQARGAMPPNMMMGGQGPQTPPSSELPALFTAWGIEFESGKVVGDYNLATSVSTGMGQISRLPTWLSLPGDAFNRDTLPTSDLDSLLFVDAGAIAKSATSDVSFTPLVETTGDAGLVDGMSLQFGSPEEAARNLAATGRKTLAALLTGKFKTAFPPPSSADKAVSDSADAGNDADAGKKSGADAAPPSSNEATADSNALSESSGTSTVLIVADTDWLFDDYSVRRLNFFGAEAAEPLNDNLAFASNVLEFLAGSQDLISLRGKGSAQRPFTVVRRMEAEAQRRYQEQLQNLDEQLSDVQRKLGELRGKAGDGNRLVASPEVQKAIEDFQKQQASMRGERRQIRAALREGIEALETRLLLLNLFIPPALVALFGVWFYRRRRRPVRIRHEA